jgi:hypothetical protein
MAPAQRAAIGWPRSSAGIIITLSFTASLSIGTAGEAEVQTALYGALGCGVAWGIVDGVLYVLSSMATRGRALASARAASAETNPVVARKHMADVMPSRSPRRCAMPSSTRSFVG